MIDEDSDLPNAPVPPAPEPAESTRQTDPCPVSEALGDPLLEIRDALRAMRDRDERNANELFELHQKVSGYEGKLDLAFGVLSEKIGESESRIVDVMKREFAGLDRSLSKEIGDVRGALGELAKDVMAHREVIDEHLAVSTELRNRAYELSKNEATADEAEERATAEVAE